MKKTVACELVSVADAAAQITHPAMGILGLPPGASGPFALRNAPGAVLSMGVLGDNGVYLNAAALRVEEHRCSRADRQRFR